MSTYYPAPRRHATPVPISPVSHRSSSGRFSSAHLAESETYIFPSPSSTPPSPSPSHSSPFSEHSDISVSVSSFSDFGSPGCSPSQIGRSSGALPQRPFLSSQVAPQNSWTVVQRESWELTKLYPHGLVPADPDIVPLSDVGAKRAFDVEPSFCIVNQETTGTTFRHPLIRRRREQPSFPCDREQMLLIETQRRSFLRESTTPSPSFFPSLLGVDKFTLDLTLPTSSDSIFFPTEESSRTDPSSWDDPDEAGVPVAPHGMEKLFSVVTEKSHLTVRQGILSFDDLLQRECCLAPFPSIWLLVTGLVSNGHEFLKQFSRIIVHSTSRTK